MKNKRRIYTLLLLLFLLGVFVIVPTAFAFEERSGETVIINADEVIEDDVYGGATNFVVDGTIKGDLIVGGQTVTINGTVEGDVMVGAQSVTINGTVGDDVRIAGAALIIGPEARIGDDLFGAGYSLETQSGSNIEGSLGFVGYQALLGGDINENVFVGSNGLDIRGAIGGDVKAEVGTASDTMPVNPFIGTPGMPAIPTVQGGITLGNNARIGGDLEYTSTQMFSIAAGQVAGEIEHFLPDVEERVIREPQSPFVSWLVRNVRRFVALTAVGFLLAWLAPAWITRLSEKLRTQPWPSLGWGTLAYFGFPVAFFIVSGVVILLLIILGLLSLGNLGGSIFWFAFAILLTLFVLFVLALIYLAKIVVSALIGKAIMQRFNPDAAEKIFWSLLVGILVVVFLIELPLIGWLLNFVLTLFGLGTLWILGRDLMTGSKEEVVETG